MPYATKLAKDNADDRETMAKMLGLLQNQKTRIKNDFQKNAFLTSRFQIPLNYKWFFILKNINFL